ncbi:MAG: hypothetical protein LUE06_06715 [Oscillospiraceae bacterium]|nr:hypothetical protein [Oscillospiraceae bacterium]
MKKITSILCTLALLVGLTACGGASSGSEAAKDAETAEAAAETAVSESGAVVSEKEYIEAALNLANNTDYTWSYDESADAWVMSIVSAVAYPEIEDEEGVSVCVPGGYVVGIDTDADGEADVTADNYTDAVNGALVIDYDAEITSTNGQVYTAAAAPVILNTGAAGYSSSTNTLASTTYAAEGYINVSCGNRGKQDTAVDENGDAYYTGDAPSCLADQKAAARFVKYNILLGNLPGSAEYFVSTGGSGGGAHATMFAATSNNPDFYPYQEAVGAVGCYLNEDGSYTTTVTIDGEEVSLSDGAWGCIAYSAITSLYEADMALAFEYYLDTDYSFGSDFQAQLAEYLSVEYIDYINAQNLSVREADAGFDLDGDGAFDSTVALTIEYDEDLYADTNGYGGTYLDLYLAEFVSNLQWYMDNLDYAEGWTWFNADGSALSDEEVAAMTAADKAAAFIEGRYTAASSGGMGGGLPSGMNGAADFAGGRGERSEGEMPDMNGLPDSTGMGTPHEGEAGGTDGMRGGSSITNENVETAGDAMDVGTPEEGTTQAAGSSTDSNNYASYEEMVAAYAADIEWQWDGGHVPSEVLSESFALYVDQMYAEYADDAAVETPAAEPQTANGTADEATGTDLSGWVDCSDIGNVTFSLSDAVSYRTAGASKAMPGFDVIDYGQEDYVFGSAEQDARHWNTFLLKIFQEHADTLAELFNAG